MWRPRLCTGRGRSSCVPATVAWAMLAVRPDGSGDLTKIEHRLDLEDERPLPLVAPVAGRSDRDGEQWWHRPSGRLSAPGNKPGRSGSAGAYWASPLHAAGGVYFFNDAGTTYVAEAGRSWKKLAENKLDDGCMASPAVAGQALFIRTKTHLYRIEEKK